MNGLKVTECSILGSKIIYADRYNDNRGSFEETYNIIDFSRLELPTEWCQDNLSVSKIKTVRGLHIQRHNPQGKLVRCIKGSLLDVWVDLRRESKTFCRWECEVLSEGINKSIYIPPGCAHGFLSLTEGAMLLYKCTTPYDPKSDSGIHWRDPDLQIDWNLSELKDVTISEKDNALPTLRDFMRTWR
jgi:dTDP-4-dehydrorhamnose 3,5-epimerase